jgi:hypothetical protein
MHGTGGRPTGFLPGRLTRKGPHFGGGPLHQDRAGERTDSDVRRPPDRPSRKAGITAGVGRETPPGCDTEGRATAVVDWTPSGVVIGNEVTLELEAVSET